MSPKNEPLKNKILLFPKAILKEVNTYIDNGYRATRIKKVLTDRYTGKLEVPSNPTIKKYITWYLENTALTPTNIVESADSALTNTKNEIQEANSLTGNTRQQILENLINRINVRLSKLENLSLADSSAALEHVVVSYMAEIRKTVETLLKLSGELNDDDKIVINIIESEMGKFFKAVADVVKDVYGEEKLPIFKDKLKRKLKQLNLQ